MPAMPALNGVKLSVADATSTVAAAATVPAVAAGRRCLKAVSLLLLLAAGLLPMPAAATPITPSNDGQVIERLPPSTRTSTSADPAVAAAEARNLLTASRREGDPRFAGRALARLARWQPASEAARAPAEVLLVLAEAEQYLHDFDGATRRLQALTQREPGNAQAWLLLATLHRVQGRYGPSDQACAVLASLRVQPYAEACAAENAALRGQFDAARSRLQALIVRAAEPSTRNWLLTSLAELEQRAGQIAASDAAWREAMQASPDTYTAVAYADFLLDQQRTQEAWDLLRPAAASEGVLLRQAIAAKRLGRSEAAALRRDIVARHAQADLRPEDSGHQRERALVALDLLDQPVKALAHARKNLTRQREPIDLWLLARCARAAGDTGALAQARQTAAAQGLQDGRLDAL